MVEQSPGTKSGGGSGGIPNGTPGGVPAYRRPIGRRHSGAADRRRLNLGGRFLGTPMGVLCEPPDWAARYVVPPIGGTVYGASFWRHCVPPPGIPGGGR